MKLSSEDIGRISVYEESLSKFVNYSPLQSSLEERGYKSLAAKDIISELRKFIALAASTPHKLVASDHVDVAWKDAILNTVLYRKMARVMGNNDFVVFVDRIPGKKKEHDLFERTLEYYDAAFGKTKSGVWNNFSWNCGVAQSRSMNIREF